MTHFDNTRPAAAFLPHFGNDLSTIPSHDGEMKRSRFPLFWIAAAVALGLSIPAVLDTGRPMVADLPAKQAISR
ncbi:hypothetical protein [Jannaschia aquimarina]|nr:hypothetical protein [Jannaschia aquimarina]